MSRRWCIAVFLFAIVLPPTSARGEDAAIFTLWPLVDYRASPSAEYRSLHLFGPLFKYESKGAETEYALRPFFYRAVDQGGTAQTEVLYPLAVSRARPDADFFDVFHLLNVDFGERESGSSNQFYLFPFLFYGEDPEQGRYAAIFPVGGTLYDWFGRDRISFALFPLYAHTERGTTSNDHVLWPIFSKTSGERESGFAVWPLYGQSEKVGVYRKRFALWPIFFDEETAIDTDNPSRRFAVLPFWFEQESRHVSQRSLLWPFFGWTQDRTREYEEWNIPWPLVRITTGSTRHGLRLLPLYADETVDARRKRWFLWPLYKIEDTRTDLLDRRRHRLLFFLYSALDEHKLDTGERKRRIDFWPLFSYHREQGVGRFHALALAEPFFPDNQAIERNWSPLWRIYQQRWDTQGNQVISVLWNLYWQERQGDRLAIELFPLFDVRLEGDERRFRLLKGLVSVRSAGGESCLGLFYLPGESCWAAQPAEAAAAAVDEPMRMDP